MIIEPTDYKAGQIKGKQRIYAFSGTNALDQIPSIVFDEELITLDQVTGRVFRNQTGSVAVSLSEPAKALPLKSPVNDTGITLEQFVAKLTAQGGLIYEDVMIVMYSLGRNVQIERDEALVAAQQAAIAVPDEAPKNDTI